MDAFPPTPPQCALNPVAPPLICCRSGEAGTHQKGSQGTTASNKSVPVVSPRRPASATAAFLLGCSTSVPGWVAFLPQASLFSGSQSLLQPVPAVTRDRAHHLLTPEGRVISQGPTLGPPGGPRKSVTAAGLPDSTRPEGRFLSTFSRYEAFSSSCGWTKFCAVGGDSFEALLALLMSPSSIQGGREASTETPAV